MLSLVTLVNNPDQQERCKASLARGVAKMPPWIEVFPDQQGWTAPQGLNHGLGMTTTPWVAFIHQDILFPVGWLERIEELLKAMPADVAIVGVVGNLRNGKLRGHIVDPNGHCYWGPLPARVLIVDEVVLIVRRGSGLRFDEEVPGFHLYGADLCLRAGALGLKSVVVDAPVTHLSTGTLDSRYELAKAWILEKWGDSFGHVIPTPAALLGDWKRCNRIRWFLLRWWRRRDVKRRNKHGLDPLPEDIEA